MLNHFQVFFLLINQQKYSFNSFFKYFIETIDESDSNEGFDVKLATKPDVNKTFYLIGISSAVLVLLISVLYHFVFK